MNPYWGITDGLSAQNYLFLLPYIKWAAILTLGLGAAWIAKKKDK